MTLSKQEKEREFHNHAFTEKTRERATPFYSVLRASRLFFEDRLLAGSGFGKSVLEYGCGTGTYAPFLAARGARVVGIDISNVAIAKATESAQVGHIDIEYRLMDAEKLEFPDNTFDLVCGVAILHHLDLAKAFAGIARVLRPEGLAVFMEPLGHNPAINIYRRLTPTLRTEDEHPLLLKDLRLSFRYFANVETRFFTLHSLLAVPLRRSRVFKQVLRLLDDVDKTVFALCPPLRRYAWQTVIVLSAPRK